VGFYSQVGPAAARCTKQSSLEDQWFTRPMLRHRAAGGTGVVSVSAGGDAASTRANDMGIFQVRASTLPYFGYLSISNMKKDKAHKAMHEPAPVKAAAGFVLCRHLDLGCRKGASYFVQSMLIQGLATTNSPLDTWGLGPCPGALLVPAPCAAGPLPAAMHHAARRCAAASPSVWSVESLNQRTAVATEATRVGSSASSDQRREARDQNDLHTAAAGWWKVRSAGQPTMDGHDSHRLAMALAASLPTRYACAPFFPFRHQS